MPKIPPVKNTAKLDSRFRFGLVPLFYAVTLVATGMSLGPQTIVFSVIAIFGWFWIFSRPHRVQTFWLAFFWITVMGICSGLMLNSNSSIRKVDRRISCQNNMRQLQLGILNYESAYAEFPNPMFQAGDGAPKHSWRVMILPFIEGQALFDQYQFNEPWDGPNNSKLASQMPPAFACPANPIPNKTPYKTVVDKGTAFEPGKAIGFDQVTDGASNTIAVVEDVANQVEWMSPEDLSIEEARAVLNSVDRSHCAHAVTDDAFVYRYGFNNVMLLDGSVASRTVAPDKAFSSNVFTIDDGVGEELVWTGNQIEEVKWLGYFSLSAYLTLIFLPAVSVVRLLVKPLKSNSVPTNDFLIRCSVPTYDSEPARLSI